MEEGGCLRSRIFLTPYGSLQQRNEGVCVDSFDAKTQRKRLGFDAECGRPSRKKRGNVLNATLTLVKLVS